MLRETREDLFGAFSKRPILEVVQMTCNHAWFDTLGFLHHHLIHHDPLKLFLFLCLF